MKYFLLTFIFFLTIFISPATQSHTDNYDLQKLKKEFINCTENFDTAFKICPNIENQICQDSYTKADASTQLCYKQTAVKLLHHYYGLSIQEATKKIDDFQNTIFQQYLFLYEPSLFCQTKECATASQSDAKNSTRDELFNYIDVMIKTLEYGR